MSLMLWKFEISTNKFSEQGVSNYDENNVFKSFLAVLETKEEKRQPIRGLLKGKFSSGREGALASKFTLRF